MRSFERLVAALRRLPGIGPKQAERLAVHVLRSSPDEAQELAAAILTARTRVRTCELCFDFTEDPRCRICSDPGRDAGVLCVVGQPSDVAALERSRAHPGLYHVLHGSLDPLRGIGPESLRVEELLSRVQGRNGDLREVILATNTDTEGEATALYLHERLQPLGCAVSRIAQGIPLGGNLDYMDERTLFHALSGRKRM